ncbi:hypothetical protein CAPTEDRAFT_217264 [Capitella teleta]|uniref:acylglycerol lipase n=1 Tax=Capitella teleta TaxID=283909 RepID=R7T7T5_CAPTE|nr:hypothetical protein CAPTEDRAFT_217264 [Capitella teleta]|eukprot:ELT89670.1 hypothetical protein CAPTEDRAFT_217264 [Capitella teleta]
MVLESQPYNSYLYCMTYNNTRVIHVGSMSEGSVEMDFDVLSCVSSNASIVVPVVLTTTVIAAAVFVWIAKPIATVNFLQNFGLSILGMQHKQVDVNGLKTSYALRGKQQKGIPSMLFIHSFSASKDMWVPLIPWLPLDQHIILLDLPGHGSTDIPDDSLDLTTPGMAGFVKKFVDTINLNKEAFHLIGISFGGAVASVYAGSYSKDLAFVTICCPAILGAEETGFVKECRMGQISLLAEDPQSLAKTIRRSCYSKQYFPEYTQIWKTILEHRRRRYPFYHKLFKTLFVSMDALSNEILDFASRITTPTQVMWGEEDELLHVSNAEVLRKRLSNCHRFDILVKCGHIPCIDAPSKMVDNLLALRGEAKRKPKLIFV